MENPNKIPKADIDKLSYCAIPINLIFSKTELTIATGTAFFYKYNSKLFLITNRHNVTGINTNTKELMNENGCQPDTLQYVGLEHKQPYIKWSRYNIKLYSDEQMMKPRWYIHPKQGNKIDVVAIEIESNPEEINAINEQDFSDLKPIIADTVYILGFPYSIKGGGNFPLWKRGSIATEPDIDIDGLPKILIDTASRKGMSGSPVIYRREGIHDLSVDGSLNSNSIIGEIQGLVGIYSGHIAGKTELEAQLGIVWKKKVIEEIIVGGILDDRKKFY